MLSLSNPQIGIGIEEFFMLYIFVQEKVGFWVKWRKGKLGLNNSLDWKWIFRTHQSNFESIDYYVLRVSATVWQGSTIPQINQSNWNFLSEHNLLTLYL